MTRDEFIERCAELQACKEAMEWLRTLPKTVKTAQQIWQRCNRADWMYWYLEHAVTKINHGDETHKALVNSACDCAELAQKYLKDKTTAEAVKTAINTIRAWTLGRATLAEVHGAASYAAANTVWAVWATVGICTSARTAVRRAATSARTAISLAALSAAGIDACAVSQAVGAYDAKCADMVRKYFPMVPKLTAPVRS